MGDFLENPKLKKSQNKTVEYFFKGDGYVQYLTVCKWFFTSECSFMTKYYWNGDITAPPIKRTMSRQFDFNLCAIRPSIHGIKQFFNNKLDIMSILNFCWITFLGWRTIFSALSEYHTVNCFWLLQYSSRVSDTFL